LSSRILNEKRNANLLFSCIWCFKEQSLSHSHSQKDPGSETRDPGSGIWKKVTPDPGDKKASDPQHWSTLCHWPGLKWYAACHRENKDRPVEIDWLDWCTDTVKYIEKTIFKGKGHWHEKSVSIWMLWTCNMNRRHI
jgi:hypothetical protein